MRPCILTDEISQDLDVALELCQRHEFKAIEVRSVWNTRPHELTLQQCRDIAKKAADHGISIAGFASPVFKCPLPDSPAKLVESEKLLAHSLEQCDALGTGLLRIFSFFRNGKPDVNAAADAMDAVLRRVPANEVTLAIETGTRSNTPSGVLTRQLLDRLERPELRVVWDPGNTVFSGFGKPDDLGDLAGLQPTDIAHVHVKDPLDTTSYVELGYGSMPWLDILDTLSDHGYRGHLSLETHWRQERIINAQERDEPWGDGFSAGGYDASNACMKTLSSWLTSRKLQSA